MKKITVAILSIASILGMTSLASAADMAVKAAPAPVVPPCTWCGFYVGINGGYGWGERTGDLTAFSAGLGIPGAVAGGTIPSSVNLRPEGWIAGAQAGYNWQVNQVVFGLEADIQASNIRKSVAILNPGGPGGLIATLSTATSELDWFGTVRGRLGWTWNSVLLYGTGGLAYGYVADNVAVNTVPPFTTLFDISNSTRVGWAAGAGFEWAVAPGWSVKGEYLRVDLGTTTDRMTFASSTVDFLDYRFKHAYDIVRVGLNYRFGGGAVVAKY